jgi:PKD repeat protein
MKKLSLLPIIILFGTFNCFPQANDSGHVEPWPGCQAYFDYYFDDSIKTFAEAYPYRFVDLSKGNIVQWMWDFGDGQTSSEPNPMHLFAHAWDTVNVCLTITTADSCSSNYCITFIVGNKPFPPDCTVDFSIVETEGVPPVYWFQPDTLKGVDSYFWDFGDGTTSSETGPSHRYEYSGIYNICVQSTNSNGCTAYACKTLKATGYNAGCKADWKTFGDILMGPGKPGISDSSYSPLARNYYFQDMSRGNVIQWHWNFGDGAESKEQNPVHAYDQNGVYDVCLDIFTDDSCASSYCDTLYVGVVPYCNLTGTVVDYTGLDGCGLLIKLDNGEILEPAEIVPNFVLKNGQRVHLAYTELKDRASICMAGKIVRIDCIGELTTDYCQASFSHYPLPWVSSIPPIYQFDDLSTGEVVSRTWDLGDGTVTTEISPSHRYAYSGLYTVCLTIYTKDGCTSTSCETSYFEGANPQPGLCDHFIRLNTEIILNGQICNGTATASLVDKDGLDAFAQAYLWSTGETSPEIHNLCPGIGYSVMVTDSAGCSISGSFSFGGSTVVRDSLFGNWNFQQDDLTFIFNVPVFSDSVYCEWDFGDGNSAGGSSVNHTYDSEEGHLVTLKVFDLEGNLLYNQQIPVSPGTPTRIRNITDAALVVYPIPVTDVLHMKILTDQGGAGKVEILTSNGQVVKAESDLRQDGNSLHLDVSGLPAGFYIGKLIYKNGLQQPFRFVKQ